MSILTFSSLREQGVSHLVMKLLLFGDSGAGKTHASVTAPKPVVLLTEPNGVLSIHASNPDAVVINVTAVAAQKNVSPMTVVREFFKAAMDGTLKDEVQAESIVIDSLTELQRMLRDEIMEQKRGSGGAQVQWTLQDWATLTDRMRKLVRAIRDLPYHVVCTALAESDTDEQERRYVTPSFQGKKFPNEIAGYFSIVGYVFRQTEQASEGSDEQVLRHRVLLSGPSTYLTKTIAPLNPVEEPNISDWLVRIRASTSVESAPTKVVSVDNKKESGTRRRRATVRAK
jgi:hypothetical protein